MPHWDAYCALTFKNRYIKGDLHKIKDTKSWLFFSSNNDLTVPAKFWQLVVFRLHNTLLTALVDSRDNVETCVLAAAIVSLPVWNGNSVLVRHSHRLSLLMKNSTLRFYTKWEFPAWILHTVEVIMVGRFFSELTVCKNWHQKFVILQLIDIDGFCCSFFLST